MTRQVANARSSRRSDSYRQACVGDGQRDRPWYPRGDVRTEHLRMVEPDGLVGDDGGVLADCGTGRNRRVPRGSDPRNAGHSPTPRRGSVPGPPPQHVQVIALD